MKNQEHNNTTPTPKASLLLMEDDLCKRESEISRNSSVGISSRIFYYYHHRSLDDGVPFKWEMQPGTPINPPPEEIVPPIAPPPAILSLSLPKPSFSVVGESNKRSLWRWKNLRKRYFSRWSSQSNMHSKDNNKAHDGDSDSCGELERLEESEDYMSSFSSSHSSSSSSSSSKDRRLIKASPRQWFGGCPPRNLKNIHTGFR